MTVIREPMGVLDEDYSSDGATITPWTDVRGVIARAEVAWLSTVRPDGRPHVTPLIWVLLDDVVYFCTGPMERKARNLRRNPMCTLTTGCNALNDGTDVVVEGRAVRVRDDDLLLRIAELYRTKYDWHFTVRQGAFFNDGHDAFVFEVRPSTVWAYGKGEPFSATRWRFAR